MKVQQTTVVHFEPHLGLTSNLLGYPVERGAVRPLFLQLIHKFALSAPYTRRLEPRDMPLQTNSLAKIVLLSILGVYITGCSSDGTIEPLKTPIKPKKYLFTGKAVGTNILELGEKTGPGTMRSTLSYGALH